MAPKLYPIQPVVAVGAVVLKEHRVLLVKRGQPPAEGLWSIPGGSVRLGETLQEAAQREILEETGVTIRAGDPIYTFDVVEREDDGRIRFHYVIIDVLAEYISGTPSAGDDAAEAGWVSSREIRDLDVSPKTRELLKARLGF